jgi:ATPase family associated with various cellular activities (AAA)
MQFIGTIRQPADHFRYAVFANMACILARLPGTTRTELLSAMPGIAAYHAAADASWKRTAKSGAKASDWSRALIQLAQAHPRWPLGRMVASGISVLHLHVLLTLLMVEEDCVLAEFVEPDAGHPTLGGLLALWRMRGDVDDPSAVREALFDLVDASLTEASDVATMRNDQRYRVPRPIAEMITSIRPHLSGLAYSSGATIDSDWISPRAASPLPASVAAAVKSGSTRSLVIRGPHHNGRKNFARRVAQLATLNLLEVSPAIATDPEKWKLAGTLAVLGDAMLLCEADAGPGETVVLPPLDWGQPTIAIVTGLSGAIATGSSGAQLTVTLPLPDPDARLALWHAAGLPASAEALSAMVLPTGNIGRAAQGAKAQAALHGRDQPIEADVLQALRGLRDARLDAVATRIDVEGEPDAIFLDAETHDEFDALLLRCRQREQLAETERNIGVRALLSGASGTGKTLAARHIARKLGKDLFRVDLSATVNKYIGETEKALERVLSAAEELDIVLLLDEGDALMAKRTDIGNSNDRYANLETNFLLQRIENFDGIILVTSNDAGRIDSAFSRRMDAVLEFSAPDEIRREEILARQLGDQARISAALMHDIACRCVLTGGQLRNVAQHARLLALDTGSGISDAQLRAAVEREYRKTNSPCPLRRALAAVS